MRNLSVGLVSLVMCSPALADAQANLAVPAGQSVPVNVAISITASLGTSTDSETKSHSLAGTAVARLSPSAPPFTGMTLQSLDLTLGPASYAFQFFCIPFLGCQNLGVEVAGLQIHLAAPAASGINGSGNFSMANAAFQVTMDYTTTGLDNGTYQLLRDTTNTFAGHFAATASAATLNQLSLSSITMDVPPESLPSGVSAISVTVNANLSGNSMTGPWAPLNPADLDGDGAVTGGDLAVMLGGWMQPGATDLNGDGQTDGTDLAMLLSTWG